jgi:hypothetical protein
VALPYLKEHLAGIQGYLWRMDNQCVNEREAFRPEWLWVSVPSGDGKSAVQELKIIVPPFTWIKYQSLQK